MAAASFPGNPGRGKTHLAIALGLKACSLGFEVLFKNAASLSTELCEARDNYRLGKLERTLAAANLFENTTMVAAMIDRLTFRSSILDMNGSSYRLKSTLKQ